MRQLREDALLPMLPILAEGTDAKHRIVSGCSLPRLQIRKGVPTEAAQFQSGSVHGAVGSATAQPSSHERRANCRVIQQARTPGSFFATATNDSTFYRDFAGSPFDDRFIGPPRGGRPFVSIHWSRIVGSCGCRHLRLSRGVSSRGEYRKSAVANYRHYKLPAQGSGSAFC